MISTNFKFRTFIKYWFTASDYYFRLISMKNSFLLKRT